jgi:hypothetical protein
MTDDETEIRALLDTGCLVFGRDRVTLLLDLLDEARTQRAEAVRVIGEWTTTQGADH